MSANVRANSAVAEQEREQGAWTSPQDVEPVWFRWARTYMTVALVVSWVSVCAASLCGSILVLWLIAQPPTLQAFDLDTRWPYVNPQRVAQPPLWSQIWTGFHGAAPLHLPERSVATRGDVFYELGIYTTVYKRPGLTSVTLRHYQAMQRELLAQSDILLRLFATGSEGSSSRALCEHFGFVYYEYRNEPLGQKHNAGLRAMRATFPKLRAVVVIGSDDILDLKYLMYCRNRVFDPLGTKLSESNGRRIINQPRKIRLMSVAQQKLGSQTGDRSYPAQPAALMIGTRDAYFLNLRTLELLYTKGYIADEASNAEGKASGSLLASKDFTLPGRCISRDLLDRCGWQPWGAVLNKGLDGSMYRSFRMVAPDESDEVVFQEALMSRSLGMLPLSMKVGDDGRHNNIHSWSALVNASSTANASLASSSDASSPPIVLQALEHVDIAILSRLSTGLVEDIYYQHALSYAGAGLPK
mmetsp:Transcript_13727/g.49949  ORF Transcript_13727/g.49949 Transcript_13727/m.49949 type:complete len:470 (-) Transcript_13727:1382-2791(-)